MDVGGHIKKLILGTVTHGDRVTVVTAPSG